MATTEAALVETVSPAMEIETVEAIGIADTTVATEAAAVEPVVPAAEIETTATDSEATPATSADLVAEPIAVEAQTADTPVAATLPDNVVVLAERRAEPRKGRSVIARTARWAAAIVLIVMAAAIAATGTGFAGNGEFLTIKDVCAIAVRRLLDRARHTVGERRPARPAQARAVTSIQELVNRHECERAAASQGNRRSHIAIPRCSRGDRLALHGLRVRKAPGGSGR